MSIIRDNKGNGKRPDECQADHKSLLIQAAYNYKKWKNETAQEEDVKY